MRGLNNGNIYFTWLCFDFIYLLRSRVESQKFQALLHTPLMSGANAISGIALVGALVLSRESDLQRYDSFFCCYFCIYKCIWWLFSY